MKEPWKRRLQAPTYGLVASVLLSPCAALGEVFDFEDAALGSVPTGWNTFALGSAAPPRWEIARDSSSTGGGNVIAQISHERSAKRTCLAILRDTELADGAVSAKIEPVSGGIDQSGGIVWRYVDEENYYVARVSAVQKNVAVYKVQEGHVELIGMVGPRTPHDDFNIALPIDVDQWNSLEVEFIGPRFVVSLGNDMRLEVIDAAFGGPGKVGLWTHGDSVTHFDAFAVSARQ